MMNDKQMMNQSILANNSQQQQMLSMGQQQPLPPVMNNSQNVPNMCLMNPNRMANQSHRGYGMWPPHDQLTFPNPNLKPKPMGPRVSNKNWKGKKGNDKWINNNNKLPVIGSSNTSIGSGNSGGGAYNPPTLNELQQQNRLKARRFFGKKKFKNHGGGGSGIGRLAPYAPRNTTSFLIRAKKAGGITSLVSPCPVTPAVLPTPIFSPSREVLVDMAKEEWGVDGYGSMKGLIRLRSPGNGNEVEGNEEDEEEGGSSESDVEEHVEVERRLDHDLSRFEMIYPNYSGVDHSSYNLENRVDDQDTHIAQLEEENLILKERLFLMEREFDDLRMRLQCLERQSRGGERLNEEVVENDSENESESRGYGRLMEDNNDTMEETNKRSVDNNNGDNTEVKESDSVEKGMQTVVEADINVANNDEQPKGLDVMTDVCMEEQIQKVEETDLVKENDDRVTEGIKNIGVSVEGNEPAEDEEV